MLFRYGQKKDLSESSVCHDSHPSHINYRVKSKTAHRGCQTAQIRSWDFAASNEHKTTPYDCFCRCRIFCQFSIANAENPH